MRLIRTVLLFAGVVASSGAAQVLPPLGQEPPAGAVTGIVYDAITGRHTDVIGHHL